MADRVAKEPKDPRSEGSGPFEREEPKSGHRLIGHTIAGKFRIVSLLAAGSHGNVFKALQVPMNREVALKILRPEVGHDRMQEFRERFLREARLAGQLQHPNVVTIHDFGETGDGSCFIALELLRGETLQEIVEGGRMSVERALPIFAQLAAALAHAHKHGVVHRDIKPTNVFVLAGDHGDFVKLFDFGLVKPDGPNDELTDAGMFMGTPHYAAPEQIRGEPCDARIDLYAMGILMYRVLAGELPFRGPSWVRVVLQHLEEPYPPMSELEPEVDVPDEVEAIVERCLQKEPDDRYADGGALLAALEAQIAVLDVERIHDESTLVTVAPMRAPPARIGLHVAAAFVGGLFACLLFSALAVWEHVAR